MMVGNVKQTRPTPTPATSSPRGRNPYLRIATSALLVAVIIGFVVYQGRQQKKVAPTASKDTRPLMTQSVSGDAATLFAWVPRYPGVELADLQTSQSRSQMSYGFSFTTKDDFDKILTFYQKELRAAGFLAEITRKEGVGGDLHGVEAKAAGPNSRTIDVTVAKTAEGSEAGVSAVIR
jgi:hypothetical protein